MKTSVGLVGLPNVGKSTLFNALVGESKSFIANYPFATIDPCQALVSVPDAHLERLAKEANSKRVIRDVIQIHDIAGLIKGASQGAGLGNAFLGHIRSVDAVLHVVRCFNDTNILHVNSENGIRDPIKDVEVVELELILADLESIEKRLHNKKVDLVEKTLLNQMKQQLQHGSTVLVKQSTTPEIVTKLKHLNLLTLKPVLYCLISDDIGGNEITKEIAKKLGGPSIPITAKLEADLADETDLDTKNELLKEFGLNDPTTESSISRLSSSLSKLLNRRVFYTIGEQEARAWAMGPNDTAVDAACHIHNDIGKHFINVEIRRELQDKPKVEGKEYLMQHQDIAYFRHRA